MIKRKREADRDRESKKCYHMKIEREILRLREKGNNHFRVDNKKGISIFHIDLESNICIGSAEIYV